MKEFISPISADGNAEIDGNIDISNIENLDAHRARKFKEDENKAFHRWKEAGLRYARFDERLSRPLYRLQLHTIADWIFSPTSKAILSAAKLGVLTRCSYRDAQRGIAALVDVGYIVRAGTRIGVVGAYDLGPEFHRGADIAAEVVEFAKYAQKATTSVSYVNGNVGGDQAGNLRHPRRRYLRHRCRTETKKGKLRKRKEDSLTSFGTPSASPATLPDTTQSPDSDLPPSKDNPPLKESGSPPRKKVVQSEQPLLDLLGMRTKAAADAEARARSKALFDRGQEVLGRYCRKPGGIVAKLRKLLGEEEALVALNRAAMATEPLKYLGAIMKREAAPTATSVAAPTGYYDGMGDWVEFRDDLGRPCSEERFRELQCATRF